MNTANTDPTTSAAEGSDPSAQLPAIIKQTEAELKQFYEEGAHMLCSKSAIRPPPGFRPQVVHEYIDPDPKAREVYVKDKGYSFTGDDGRQISAPDTLELTKIGVTKLARMKGVSWDSGKSGRVDDGRNPAKYAFKAVGYLRDHYGEIIEISATKTMDLDKLMEISMNSKCSQLDAYHRKLGTKYEQEIPRKWLKALKAGKTAVEDLLRSELRAERLMKDVAMPEQCETGAKLRAIREGLRTSYTAEELEKPFVDIRLFRLNPDMPAAERANNALYGRPRITPGDDPEERPEERIIDATSRREPDDPPKAKPTRRESILMDFEACDKDQKAAMLKELAARVGYPSPMEGVEKWSEVAMRGTLALILDMQEGGGDS